VFCFSVDGIGCLSLQGTVGSYMAVLPKEAGQVDFSLPAIALGTQIHLLALDRSPKPLHKDVDVAALSS
jgi:hypothetical protein